MVSGEWSGTMCLTEPHCGTDLGLLRSRAEPEARAATDTGPRSSSRPASDLTENIVHLVLARLPDAPKGVKGISLFLVPKYLPDADGTPVRPTAAPAPRSSTRWASRRRPRARCCSRMPAGWWAKLAAWNHVHDDECRTRRRRHPGPGHWRGGLSVGLVCERPFQGRSLSGAKHPDKPPIRSSSTPTCAACC
jgi:hypothetical protein